jgi:hypothetical protein
MVVISLLGFSLSFVSSSYFLTFSTLVAIISFLIFVFFVMSKLFYTPLSLGFVAFSLAFSVVSFSRLVCF